MKNKKVLSMLVIGGMVVGAIGSIGLAAFAQSNTPQPVAAPIVSQQSSDTDNIQDKGGIEVPDQISENNSEKNDANDVSDGTEAPGTEVPDAQEAND